jgi:hypothetical protein
MCSKRFLPLLACLLITASHARTWMDNQGRTLEADYVSPTGDEVLVVRKNDKQQLSLKLSQWSENDLAFVSSQAAAKLPPREQVTTPNESRFAPFRSRLKRFVFTSQSCPAKYLGVVSLVDRPFGKLPFSAAGISLGKDGGIIVSSGNGTTPHMKLVKWSPKGGVVDIVPLIYQKFDHKSFSPSERADDERAGRFWFFGGQVAHDRNDQVLFTHGACGGNGIVRVVSDAPVQLQRLNECIASSSLQVPPWDNFIVSLRELGCGC